MNNNDEINKILGKPPLEIKKQLNIKNKDFMNVSNDILTFQHYLNLLKGRDLSYSLEFTLNDLANSFKKQKTSPAYVKIRKDLNQINSHIYNVKNRYRQNTFNNTTQSNKKFMDKFNIIINSSSYVPQDEDKLSKNNKNKDNIIMSLKDNHIIKQYKKKEKRIIKDPDNGQDNNEKEDMRNNTVENISNNQINKTRIKFGYGNYAFPYINYNHPQFYKLNNIFKEKLPPIENPNINKKRKPNDLSESIPFDNKKKQIKNNFYNYYIGLRIKHKFC